MTIHIGDALTILRTLPADSVQCCVTSPPYWGLRDYGTATWEGGDNGCDHTGKPMATRANINRNCGTGNDVKNAEAREFYRETCGKCGARRIDAQLGLEPTPAEYVANMVAVFREVRRVLRDDGTLWLNLGDSYFGTGKGPTPPTGIHGSNQTPYPVNGVYTHDVLKGKDLCGIPWRVAFALQADGFYLRQDIIWHKPNPMPESVRDRCTKAHEYIFLLSKSERYYFDAQAIAEPAQNWGTRDRSNFRGGTDDPKLKQHGLAGKEFEEEPTRNKRSVWTITTKPFKEAHFATFPPEIPERCIKAGSKPGDTILDPFTGSGTTGMVAAKLGRAFIGCELNHEYAEMARRRIASETSKHALFSGGQA